MQVHCGDCQHLHPIFQVPLAGGTHGSLVLDGIEFYRKIDESRINYWRALSRSQPRCLHEEDPFVISIWLERTSVPGEAFKRHA